MIRRPRCRSGFYFQDDLAEANEIHPVMTAQWPAFVFDVTRDFCLERNSPRSKFQRERVLVEQLEEAGTKHAMHLLCGADDPVGAWIVVWRYRCQHERAESNLRARCRSCRIAPKTATGSRLPEVAIATAATRVPLKCRKFCAICGPGW